jgi:subtilisin family serine protease
MKLTKRRVTVGLVSGAVVATMTSVSTWALAEDKTRTAAAEPVRLVVGLKDGVTDALGARRTASGTGRQSLAELDATTVEVPASSSASAIAALRSDPKVAWVEVDRVRKAFDLTPNDPLFVRQPEMLDIKAPAAWEQTTGSAVKIAVVDTGVIAGGDLVGAVTTATTSSTTTIRPTTTRGTAPGSPR